MSQAIKNEFYASAFRRKLYTSLDELQADVDVWIESYNAERAHSGKDCYGKTPLQTFIESAPAEYEGMMGQSSPAPTFQQGGEIYKSSKSVSYMNVKISYRSTPNLNLIERLWEFVKKQCLYSKYYEKFAPFKRAISDFLALTSTKYRVNTNRYSRYL